MTKKQWKLILEAVIGAILTIIGIVFATSCSTMRASIKQPKDNSTTTITISTNNPQSIETNGQIQLKKQ